MPTESPNFVNPEKSGETETEGRFSEAPDELSRRGFLRKALVATVGTVNLEAFNKRHKKNAHVEKPESTTNTEKITGKKYNTGWLAGKTFRDLYIWYTGVEGKVPPEVTIDFPKQLGLMWRRKFVRSNKNAVVVQTGKKIIHNYIDHEPHVLTAKEYQEQIQKVLTETFNNMDWEKLGSIKHLSHDKLELVKNICHSVNAKHLMAYCLTELMPSTDGLFNVEVLNFLLKSAGKEYIESIPAMFDKKVSFGPYQFTEFALYDSNGEKRGASIPNQALKDGKIPGSVAELKGMDHHKAAYLFMIDNFSNLVNKLSADQQKTLHDEWQKKANDLVGFAATAHHLPAPAITVAKRWLDNGAKLPFEVSCGRALGQYAHKTDQNFKALLKLDS